MNIVKSTAPTIC